MILTPFTNNQPKLSNAKTEKKKVKEERKKTDKHLLFSRDGLKHIVDSLNKHQHKSSQAKTGTEKRKRWQVGNVEKQLLTFDHKHHQHFPCININCKNYKHGQKYVHSNNLATEKSLQVVNSETPIIDWPFIKFCHQVPKVPFLIKYGQFI